MNKASTMFSMMLAYGEGGSAPAAMSSSPATWRAVSVEAILLPSSPPPLELDHIDRSLVLPICLDAEAGASFPAGSRGELDRYLAAAKRLLRMEAFGDMERRRKCLLDTAMTSISNVFCRLNLWRLVDEAGDHTPASIWRSAVRCSHSCSTSSDGSSPGSWPSCTSFAGSGGTSGGEEPSSPFSGMICIERKSLSALDDIARIMIRGGYQHILRGAFEPHCAQLARYIEIFDINKIFGSHMEEPRDNLVKVWTSTMRILTGLLTEMQRELDQQDLGSFNSLKEEYFLTIARISILKLLNSASSIIQVDDSSCNNTHTVVTSDLTKIITVVKMYKVLDRGMPTILSFFSGKTKEDVVAEGEKLINRLSNMFFKLSVELNNKVRSEHMFITNTGVHRATKYMMHHIRLVAQQKNTIHLILKGDFKAFGEMLTRLILSLEFMLNMNSRSLQLRGQQQIFRLNNVHFLLEEANKDTVLRLILGQRWFSQCSFRLEQFIEDYVDASWAPLMSSFRRRTKLMTILWSHRQLFEKFASSLKMTCTVQKTWKVSDQSIRQKLRMAISQRVIPLYQMHMEYYSEKMCKSEKYSIEQIESEIRQLFEG
ncbi:hypothetical protein EJB05_30379, partial [Eragrostis curvula]